LRIDLVKAALQLTPDQQKYCECDRSLCTEKNLALTPSACSFASGEVVKQRGRGLMKKFLVVICSVVPALGLAGCIGKGKAPVGKGKAPVVQTRG
jgi:hypothetical protein